MKDLDKAIFKRFAILTKLLGFETFKIIALIYGFLDSPKIFLKILKPLLVVDGSGEVVNWRAGCFFNLVYV